MPAARSIVLWLMSALLLAAPAAWAQQKKEEAHKNANPNPLAGSPLFWRTDWILEAYVKAITRHYNLNKDQEEYTRKLLSQRVKDFLNDHEREARALIAQYMEYQMSQELPDPETAKEFAKKAGPLVKQIRKEIFEGNMRWREILDDQQRAKHDQDLRQMTNFFDGMELGLERWKEGRVQPSDLPGRLGARPPRLKIEDAWDYWVRTFIRSYKLDEGQQQTAQSVLRELKAEAARYRDANKDKFTEMEAASAKLSNRSPKTEPTDLAKYQEETRGLQKRKEELETPIRGLFDQLRTRVEAIPTTEQRRVRQQELERLRAQARQRPTTRPETTQPAASSQPTTSQGS